MTTVSQKKIDPASLPLGMIAANEINRNGYCPPEEIVEGLLAAGAGSIIFGNSNTGKTYLALDVACAVARGVEWMGRQTVPGLVIYLASESPESVCARLYAYQKYHNCDLRHLIIVRQPINLMATSNAHELIRAIKLAEKQTGIKTVLIIGDTLSRMTAGANENSGEDMGLFISHFDLIRRETCAHFCILHHSGKDEGRGARGHSSLRAAVDTEIQVSLLRSENGGGIVGRRAKTTKQRDLPVGDAIDFELKPIQIGVSQWGKAVTSCVVVDAANSSALARKRQEPPPLRPNNIPKKPKKHIEQIDESKYVEINQGDALCVLKFDVDMDTPGEDWENVMSGFELKGGK